VGFVKSGAEIERITQAMSRPEFLDGESLAVTFLTDPDVVRRILPPGLEPGTRPTARVSVNRYAGGSCGPWIGGSIRLRARHEGIKGDYVLAMYMASDNALLFGRELFGEPKKMCSATLDRSQDGRVRAVVERGGTVLIEINAELDADVGPSQGEHVDFNYKAPLAADGSGLAGDPSLVMATMRSEGVTTRPGRGTLVLKGTPHDPLDEIPIREILSTVYGTGFNVSAEVRELRKVPAADFIPYAFGRLPDWGVFASESRR
jgi:acetoacetate decarboxylase